jgi:serine/threonine protein kinase
MDPTPQSSTSTFGPTLARQVDAVCDRFEEACRAGERPRAEDYAHEVPELARPALLRELKRIEAAYAAFGPDDGETLPSLPGFAFERVLGRGSFGEVWLATDVNLGQPRAVKLLRRHRSGPLHLELLVEEARKMASLPPHRNRVAVHALVPALPSCYLLMDYVEGGPLSRQTSPTSPLPWERAARYVADVADALVEVHAAGILHRDIKPANILWDRRRDEALLADYGIAAYTAEARGLAGTSGYIAPELGDGAASPKSDVFSLAATLFCLVSGRAPFAPGDVEASLAQARAGLVAAAPLDRVPAALRDAILEGLRPEPTDRPDLPTFTARLRGAHLQALADKLLRLARPTVARLQVMVAAADEGDLVFRPIACDVGHAAHARDLEPVAEPAPVTVVRTGQLVRLEVTADADGYLTVLNLGSSGNLHVLFPNPLARDNRIHAGRPHRLTVKLTPPTGTDRAAVLWTRGPSALSPAEWRERIEAGLPAALPPEESARGMDLVLHEADGQPADAWTAAVVTITHTKP